MQDYDATHLVTKFPGVSASILIDQVKDHVCVFSYLKTFWVMIEVTIVVAGISFDFIKFVLLKKSVVVANWMNQNGQPDIMLFIIH